MRLATNGGAGDETVHQDHAALLRGLQAAPTDHGGDFVCQRSRGVERRGGSGVGVQRLLQHGAFALMPAASSPVPAPVHSASDRPHRRANSRRATELAMPISCKQRVAGRSRSSSIPFSAWRALRGAHARRALAGVLRAGATLRSNRRSWPVAASRGAMSRAAAVHHGEGAGPCWRASALDSGAAGEEVSTICGHVAREGRGTARWPGRGRRTTICGCSSQGAMQCPGSGAQRKLLGQPSEPRGLVLWVQLVLQGLGELPGR